MQGLPLFRASLIAGICLCLGLTASGPAQNQPAAQSATAKEKVVAGHASGTFDVKLTPQTDEGGADAGLGRMSIDKQFHGDIGGSEQGIYARFGRNDRQRFWGYVAMERVTGKLKGRTGCFVLQHNGTMTRGAPQLSVTVVPDSGTDQLTGIAGTLTIQIDAGKHSYEFEYTLPEAP